jgi:hypothetical protein
MKKNFLLTWSAIIFICLSGFTPNKAPVTKKQSSPAQLAWIYSNYEETRGCPGQHYVARDLEPGDTVTWYRWIQSNPEIPLVYMGSSIDLYYDFDPFDIIILVVNEGGENEYSTGEWIKECWY